MRIIFTVTNDLNYDQRMIRICNSLSEAGWEVVLIGTQFGSSPSLQEKKYEQKRIGLFFRKGFFFYFEYNLRLFIYLLFRKADIFCCIDLDTMLPVYFASVLRGKVHVYDAHEFFSEQKEIVTRALIHRFWHFIEKRFVPKFRHGYTVSEGIATEFKQQYGVSYEVIRNVPLKKPVSVQSPVKRNVLYRGSVNEGRGFEYLIPAMHDVNSTLVICGEGNFFEMAQTLVVKSGLQDKILFKGKLLPPELDKVTQESYIGINLVEPVGKNQYLSLANKFFDYIQNGIPQITMNFPSYRSVNERYPVAILIDDLTAPSISNALNELLGNEALYRQLKENCWKARDCYNWQKEKEKLIEFYYRVRSPQLGKAEKKADF